MSPQSILPPILAVVGAPLMMGITNRVKAIFAGRQGPPLLQPYYDLARLIRKGAVFSHTTTWVFRAGPTIGLAAALAATLLVPLGHIGAPLAFDGDLVLFVYLLGIIRLWTVLAALDTGSPFEGMGASREVFYAALAEPALLLALAAVARETRGLSLSAMHLASVPDVWGHAALTFLLVALVLAVVYLVENSRIPIDDPNTHLELTMIHEVMVLDHSGPDLAYIVYTAALKLWLLGALLIGLVWPFRTGSAWLDLPLALVGMGLVAASLGVVESTIARLRLLRIQNLLAGAVALSILALVLEYEGVLLRPGSGTNPPAEGSPVDPEPARSANR